MKRLSPDTLSHPVHRTLQEKDERELYGRSPVDYYALHYRRRIAAVCALIRRHRAKRILEIGAAQGNMSLLCAEAGCSCVALDLNFNHLSYSRMKHETGTISWVRAGADALPFKAALFDAVILGELLEHCAFPEAILARAAEMLAPAGVIIITTPNHSYVNGTEQSFSQVAGDRQAIAAFQFGPDGNDHLFTFTESELRQVVASAGLRVVGLRYLGSHVLHLRSLYHLRVRLPIFFNRFLEWVVPRVPWVRRNYTSTIVMVAGRQDKGLE